MFLYTGVTATFNAVVDVPGTIDVSGTFYRVVPHSTMEPTSTQFTYEWGGRWNAPFTFPVLYTSSSVQVARNFVDWTSQYYGLPLGTPDLLVFNFSARVADFVTDQGLIHYGLPTSYPLEHLGPDSHWMTQPFGQAVFDAGLPGLASRSAVMTSWVGSIGDWADLAIFTTQSPPAVLSDRLPFSDWYPYVC